MVPACCSRARHGFTASMQRIGWMRRQQTAIHSLRSSTPPPQALTQPFPQHPVRVRVHIARLEWPSHSSSAPINTIHIDHTPTINQPHPKSNRIRSRSHTPANTPFYLYRIEPTLAHYTAAGPGARVITSASTIRSASVAARSCTRARRQDEETLPDEQGGYHRSAAPAFPSAGGSILLITSRSTSTARQCRLTASAASARTTASSAQEIWRERWPGARTAQQR